MIAVKGGGTMQKSLKNRDIYLRQLKAFQDTEMIKVITSTPLRKVLPDEADGGAFARQRYRGQVDYRNEF